ncbi:hypothetical protein T4C_7203 [Trichinella pseudospiralis]|uniref:Uncharacterized protein n=1 Tax=Trichinella pseudospiralis TaxID=6337 RepID=A0A0V1KGQ7_TRIPS|nr:hypothetical protein T4C_7203 [Trichinella pseudospiralis]
MALLFKIANFSQSRYFSVKTTRIKKVIRENEKRARKGAEVLPERSAKELFLHCNCASVSYMNSVNKLLRFAHRIPD